MTTASLLKNVESVIGIQNMNNILVLEGRNEIGGRTRNTDLGGFKVDLGGAWMDGPEGNPLLKYANIVKGSQEISVWDGKVKKFLDAGWYAKFRVWFEKRIAEWEQERENLLEEAEDADSPPESNLVDVSMMDVLSNLTKPPSDLYNRTFWSHINHFFEEYNGGRIEENSLYFFEGIDNWRWSDESKRNMVDDDEEDDEEDEEEDEDEDNALPFLKGGEHFVLNSYGEIFKTIAKPFLHLIKVNQFVTDIDYTAKDHILVTARTPDGIRTYEADVVIVTVPLGTLKRKTIQFKPRLPKRHQKAIRNIGFGLLNKIVLLFDEVWWEDLESEWFIVNEGTRFSPSFLNVAHYNSSIPMLILFPACQIGETYETLPDEDLIGIATGKLKRMFPTRFQHPKQYVITRWKSDPLSYGSYSFPKPETRVQDFLRLSEPIDKRIILGGEATVLHYGFVHGAYFSGEGIAKKLVNGF